MLIQRLVELGSPFLPTASNVLRAREHWPAWLRDGGQWTLAVLPRWVLQQAADGKLRLWQRTQHGEYISAEPTQPSLRLELQQRLAELPSATHVAGFNGGIIGWLGYGGATARPLGDFPLACLAGYDTFIKPGAHDSQILLYAASSELLEQAQQLLATPSTPVPFQLLTPFRHCTRPDGYAQAFDRIQGYLRAGDCYQVNFAQTFRAQCRGDSLTAFHHLLQGRIPPHAAYFSAPHGDILSLSPELFLRFDGNQVLTRPIKGTRPRGRDAEEDRRLRQDLATHGKDRAENLMIVDLLRNDLGRHARTGSVRVPELFRIETFEHVHHLVSDVQCVLKPDSQPLDLLFDAFPGGSITGAPKRRAMEIIDELESEPRAIYCGSMGYQTPTGRGEWNIAIRTLLRVGDTLHAWAGGGIVADSVCLEEYQECFNKIGPIIGRLEQDFLADSTIPPDRRQNPA